MAGENPENLKEEPPVRRLVELVISHAIKEGAQEIRFEPLEQSVSLQCRVNGVWQPIAPPAKVLYPAIVGRLKVLAGVPSKLGAQPGKATFLHEYGGASVTCHLTITSSRFGDTVTVSLARHAS
ncbi:MAG: hypothetical protein HY352_02060 [Candidatus Omnitrophica bacterium]|nr:hypothetical protein [Candidatus Omnitrophota bacterium]